MSKNVKEQQVVDVLRQELNRKSLKLVRLENELRSMSSNMANLESDFLNLLDQLNREGKTAKHISHA